MGLPGLPVGGIDRRQAAVGAALGVVGHPERLEVPRRHDVLRVDADPEPVDDLERGRIDHVDVVGLHVRHVDARQRARHRRAQLARAASRCRGCAGSGTGGMPGTVSTARPPGCAAAAPERQRPQEPSHHTETPPSPRARRRAAPRPPSAATRPGSRALHRRACETLTSPVRDRLPDRLDRPRHDQLHAEPARARRAARVGSPSTPSPPAPRPVPGRSRSSRTSRGSSASISDVSASPAWVPSSSAPIAARRRGAAGNRPRSPGSTPRWRARAPACPPTRD